MRVQSRRWASDCSPVAVLRTASHAQVRRRLRRTRSWNSPLCTRKTARAATAQNGRGGAAIALADPVYLAIADDAAMRKVIANGVTGTSMPAFAQSAGGMLTDKQIDVLSTEIRSRWGRQGILDGANPPSYAAKSVGDAQRGEAAYKTYCESCHGPAGQGGPKGSAITNDSFLALVSDQGLRTIVITGRPELGAPDWRGNVPGKPMSDQEVTDVVAWLASMRAQTPGQPYAASNSRSTRSNDDVKRNDTFPPRAVREVGNSLQRIGGDRVGRTDRTISSLFDYARTRERLPFLGAARPRQRLPGRRDAAGYFPQSVRDADRRQDRRTRPAGCAASKAINSRSSPSTARTSVVRFAGFRNPDSSCARATAELTTATARAPPDRRSAVSSNIRYKVENGVITIQAGELPTPGATPLWSAETAMRIAGSPDQHSGQ